MSNERDLKLLMINLIKGTKVEAEAEEGIHLELASSTTITRIWMMKDSLW